MGMWQQVQIFISKIKSEGEWKNRLVSRFQKKTFQILKQFLSIQELAYTMGEDMSLVLRVMQFIVLFANETSDTAL